MFNRLPAYFFNGIKLLLAIVVFYFLYRSISIPDLKDAFREINHNYLTIAVVLMFGKYLVYGIRWAAVARIFKIHTPLSFFTLSAFELQFLELIFPVPDAEDVLKVTKMINSKCSKTEAISIMLIDRLIGVVLLILLLPFTAYYFYDYFFESSPYLLILMVVVTVLSLALLINFRLIVFTLLRLASRFKSSFFGITQTNYLEGKLPAFGTNMIGPFFMAAIHHFMNALIIYFILLSFDSPINILYLLISVPILYFSVVIPVSYQGIGLYEAAIVLILPFLGASIPVAQHTAIIHFGIQLMVIVTGAFIFILNKKPISTEEIRSTKSS